MDLNGLRQRIGRTLYLTDWDVLTTIHGTILANQAAREPVWLILVGPPATGKTQLTAPLEALEGVRLLNDISDHTFVSGLSLGKKGNQSLLPKLSKAGIYQLINLDFGNIFAKPTWTRQTILSQMRQIYDGKITLDRGSGDEVAWKGFMGFIGCATPAIYHHQQTISNLGDRFFFIRVDPPEGDRSLDRCLANLDSFSSVTSEIATDYLEYHKTRRDPLRVALSEGSKRFLKTRSILLAKLRANIKWSKGYGRREIEERPFAESPNRIIRSAAMLLRGIAAAKDLAITGPDEEAIIERIFIDTAPPGRIQVLQALMKEPLSKNVLSKKTGLSRGRVDDILQELRVLDLAVKKENGDLWEPTQIVFDGLGVSDSNVVKFISPSKKEKE